MTVTSTGGVPSISSTDITIDPRVFPNGRDILYSFHPHGVNGFDVFFGQTITFALSYVVNIGSLKPTNGFETAAVPLMLEFNGPGQILPGTTKILVCSGSESIGNCPADHLTTFTDNESFNFGIWFLEFPTGPVISMSERYTLNQSRADGTVHFDSYEETYHFVPEPATGSLLATGLGLAAVSVAARRRWLRALGRGEV